MEPIKTELVVLGAGPGGYAAAFYAADKGKKVILVDKGNRLGGACLNVGCIPSKALIHATAFMREMKSSEARGVVYAKPQVDLNKLRTWKNSILDKLGQGIQSLAKNRNVQVIQGRGHFEGSQTLRVETQSGQKFINYDNAIIATGSLPAVPSAFDLGNKRVMTSSEALEIEDIPETLLVVGGGYIGLELGTVYATLGSQVVVVEMLGAIMPGSDPDLTRPVLRYAKEAFKNVRVNTKVTKMESSGKKINVTTEFEGKIIEEKYDRVLVSIGRVPNVEDLGLENTKVKQNSRGFVEVNEKLHAGDSNIYAIGDVTGSPMLAHRASKQARIAVDALCGEENAYKDVIIPSVVFTDPEMAWCGLTETEAKEKGINVEAAKFMWGASGRALTLDRPDGVTKFIIEPETERILGVGIVGVGAGDLIGEGVLAVEMGATVRDIAESVHPHPTLSETLMETAESFYGTATHAVKKRGQV